MSRPESRFAPALLVVRDGEARLSGHALAELCREILGRRATFRFRAKGSSMAPFIREGDVLTVAAWDDRAPRRGDVAAFAYPGVGKLAVHRIVRVGDDAAWLRGDNGGPREGPVDVVDVIGRVVRVERGGREAGFALRSGGRFAAAVWRNGPAAVWRVLRGRVRPGRRRSEGGA